MGCAPNDVVLSVRVLEQRSCWFTPSAVHLDREEEAVSHSALCGYSEAARRLGRFITTEFSPFPSSMSSGHCFRGTQSNRVYTKEKLLHI